MGATLGTLLVRSRLEAADSSAKKEPTLQRADFYDAQGKFLVAKARDAYFAMLKGIHYPVTPAVEKNIWIDDFGLGDFPRVGMGGMMWINRQEYGYMGLDIFLLPGQMIPEHSHVATDKAKPKMESWQVRSGMVWTFGEGEPTPELLDRIPESQRATAQSKHGVALGLHETGDLNRVNAWHFMIAGPEGALVTEYGLFQDGAALRFSNPQAKV
jgi:D-lyxose ketol-isomerase